jgi:hypothetical protein
MGEIVSTQTKAENVKHTEMARDNMQQAAVAIMVTNFVVTYKNKAYLLITSRTTPDAVFMSLRTLR